ncbi:ketoacyl-synt-domain-containing protein [Xylariaceae sp. FL0662B]|nr:ketoacyl-synt-domain-containing protein [Xylariaceae sp. FL0662B]
MAQTTPDGVEPIAVIGMGCRFPGGAVTPSQLWQMLCRGESAWSEIPGARLNISSYFHPSGNRQGSIPFQAGHFLAEDVGVFDSSFFSIPADEAKAIDPQQRILLEVSVEALDNAGIDRNTIKKTDTGVWIGSFVKDYEQIVLRDPDFSPKYGATGNGIAIMSNRISFFLDINGPSMTIDTGCSASLVCVHNACQSLRDGEVDIGIAGGAGLILTPNTMMPMTALNFLSPDGKCYTFDERANGYGRGEGIGVVILKRLKDAIRDNDNIRAVIRGSRVNQDGRTPGITLPSSEAQLRNIRAVYEKSKLAVEETSYVECHGTGTQAGDWRELKAVSDAFCGQRAHDNPIYVGSVKTNIGHLEGCAGVAGLIKGVLTIENGMIPRHLNFEPPGNPSINFKDWKVKVPVENTPWPVTGLRRASVNCFGFGGTNCHVILDDAAHYLARRALIAHHNTTILDDTPDLSTSTLATTDCTVFADHTVRELVQSTHDPSIRFHDSKTHLFIFSAHEQMALSRMVNSHISYIQGQTGDISDRMMEDLAYTLGCRRTKLQWRISIVAQSLEELAQKLTEVNPGSFVRTPEDKVIKVAFVFGGQGAQWYAMGRELLGFDTFLQSIVEATLYLQHNAGAPFSLLAELLKDERSSRIDQPEISQPATTAIQIALVDLMTKYYSVMPTFVCGHSSGEIAAAYALGALSREDAWELAYHRGRCAAALQGSGTGETPGGRMLAVGLSASEAEKYVERIGSRKVVVACINSPSSVTLSGDGDVILKLQEVFQAAGIFNRLLVVNIAYHSPHMQRCQTAYLESISHIRPRQPVLKGIPHPHTEGRLVTPHDLSPDPCAISHTDSGEVPIMYSSVTGDVICWDQLSPDYWVKNMVSPVRFSDAMTKLVNGKGDERPYMIIELSPQSSLQTPISQILGTEEKPGNSPFYLSVLSRKKDAAVSALETVGKLWQYGCSIVMPWVVMRNIQFRRPKVLTDLPKYPWNHDHVYWHESHLSLANRFQLHGRYDLIGRPTADSIPFQPRWRGFFRLSENPWIQEHQVQKTIIYPAAGMIAMVLEATKQLGLEGSHGVEITQFGIKKAMIIPPTAHGLEHALNLNKQTNQAATAPGKNVESFQFSIYSKQLDGPWQEHGEGLVTIHRRKRPEGTRAEHQLHRENQLQSARHYQAYLDTKNNCDETIMPRQLYETLDVIGMNYGPVFRNISSLYKKDNACIATIRIPDTRSGMPANFEFPHIIHPATLDSIFQTAFAIGGEPMVPSFISSFYVSMESSGLPRTGEELVTHTHAERRRLRDASASFIVSDASWLASSGPRHAPLITIKDMNFTALKIATDSVEGGFLPNHRTLCSEIVWENMEVSIGPDAKQEVGGYGERPIETSTRLLVLIPVDLSPGINRLCVELAKGMDCEFRTLNSITQDESLPNLCLSLLEINGQSFVWDWTEDGFVAFRTVVTAVRRLFWITRASQFEATNPKSCLFQALSRTIHSEYPEKALVAFDIGHDQAFTDKSTPPFAQKILDLLRNAFFGSNVAKPKETEYIERDGKIMVPRLVPVKSLNSMIERGAVPADPEIQYMPNPCERPLKLRIREIGKLESLYWDDDSQANLSLPPDMVNVRVITTTLCDLDNDIVHGRARDHSLGTDVYGVVEEIGERAVNIAVGDYVVGITRGSLRDFVRCHHQLLYKVSEDQSQNFHIRSPTSLSVAYSELRSLSHRDTVLIHGGAGPFGQAAIQVARFAGATIFASATANHQRGILHHYWNIPEERILDGNGSCLVDTVARLTKGRGVDVVYDPTISNQDVNIRCVSEGGRIVTFARKPHESSMSGRSAGLTGKSFSCTILDIPYLVKQQPTRLADSLAFICPKVISGTFRMGNMDPVPLYDYSDLPAAFEALSSDRDCGQVYCQRPTSKPVSILPRPPHSARQALREDATYILSGGLGGLGIEIAKLLELNGVKHIVFLSRSGATTELAKACIAFLNSRYVKVQVCKVDICDKEALQETCREMMRSMPPVKGVFQCAAVLRDSVFENMTYEDWKEATRPKTIGSWNLHQVLGCNLDFFIFLSSSAGVIGNRGQANYAAANAFQDSLARHINSNSGGTTHAVSVDLGPILGAGMLADDPRTLDKLKASGFFGIRLQDFKRLIECAITGYTQGNEKMPAQVVTGVGTGGLVRQNKPADPYWTRTAMFTHLNKVDLPAGVETASADDAADSEDTMRRILTEVADTDEAASIINEGLRIMLSKSMNMHVEDVDESRPPSAYGVDSLVAVGVRSWVFRQCNVDVSVFEVLGDSSIKQLSAMIAQRGGFGIGGG